MLSLPVYRDSSSQLEVWSRVTVLVRPPAVQERWDRALPQKRREASVVAAILFSVPRKIVRATTVYAAFEPCTAHERRTLEVTWGKEGLVSSVTVDTLSLYKPPAKASQWMTIVVKIGENSPPKEQEGARHKKGLKNAFKQVQGCLNVLGCID